MEKEKKEHLNRKQLLPFCNETDLTNGPSYKSTRKKERKKKSFSDLVTLISSTSLGAFADEEPRWDASKLRLCGLLLGPLENNEFRGTYNKRTPFFSKLNGQS
ncbi:hypothetical protein TNCV_2298751 [Trichonephila clavipes]|nr:hypothetical protein TNCV_2298751 [Trichonephila clavipes]